jgi:hypothetical protein
LAAIFAVNPGNRFNSNLNPIGVEPWNNPCRVAKLNPSLLQPQPVSNHKDVHPENARLPQQHISNAFAFGLGNGTRADFVRQPTCSTDKASVPMTTRNRDRGGKDD